MSDKRTTTNNAVSFNYRTLPALAAYIDRIGAEELNFRRFMVKERKGKYYIERALIKIEGDGTVKCNTIVHAPTKEEKEAIKAEIVKCNWPRAIGAKNSSKIPVSKDLLYEFWNRERTHIIMCQQRVENDDGDKYYVPWTFFSDGEWRRMEPDGALPFWKPKETRDKGQLMLHEGAKAAAFIDGMLYDPKRRKEREAHPWTRELEDYEHWGMIGGALAPHRSDYNEIYQEKPTEVVYVCDNDFSGGAALQEVSKHYGRALKGIQFMKGFEHSWDMADPMPKGFYKGKRWIGPTLDSLKSFATYATEAVPVEDGKTGRQPLALKQVFAEEWIHCVKPDVYIHKDWPNDIMDLSEFDDRVRPFSGTMTTSRLIKGCNVIKSSILKYIPGKEPGLYGGAGKFFNTHCPSKIKREAGDATQFLEYMEHLFPNPKDCEEVKRWVATLIARPDIRMMYALLLISETQGVGKSTLGERILTPLVGDENASSPSETDVVEGDYTYWQAHKRLAVVNEIYAGHSSKAYNKLKPLITDRTITVKKKYLAHYEIDNWLHIVACSNNFNALRLTGDDRRWFIPKVTEKKMPEAYWGKFNRWLTDEGGLGIIMNWCYEFLEDYDPVGHGEAAPWSAAKLTVIEEGYSPGMQMVANILDAIKDHIEREKQECAKAGVEISEYERRWVMMDTDFVTLIKMNLHEGKNTDKLERPATIRRIAKTLGWFIGEEPTKLRDGTRGRLICSDPDDAEKKPCDLFQEVVPTRIGRLEKSRLIIRGDEPFTQAKERLDDPMTLDAIKNGRLTIKNRDKTEGV